MDGIKRIEYICSQVPDFRKQFESRVRHYVLKDHTLNVYNQFYKYFLNDFPEIHTEEFKLFLLLHDIGKSIAHKSGNRNKHYLVSIHEIDRNKRKLSLSDDCFSLYKSLLKSSTIGKYMENKIPLEDMVQLILEEAKSLKLSIRSFFYLLSVYYQCDIASYTKDAGGYPYLEHLFMYENGEKIYDNNLKLLKFSSLYQNRYDSLFAKILENEKRDSNNINIIKSSRQKRVQIKIIDKIDLSKFKRPQKEIKKNKKNIYIIDTNVFIDYPQIISKINKEYPVILSAKVIDELDNLKSKLDGEGKKKVQRALKSINKNLDTRELKMEMSDVSLIPGDFNKKSPDNQILSVALKFKSENPILLTSDNGLQVKAKGMNITTISLNEFLKQNSYY